jgi:RNA polymerase sigma factor (sigma-70 family)
VDDEAETRRAVASDAELIGRSLSGDLESFVEVVSRHEAAVWAYLVRRAGRGLAEDLLGEVWALAFESRGAYDRSFPDARPWLFGVARNALRRHWRSRRADHVIADLADAPAGLDPWPAVDERIDGMRALRRALAQLRPEEREVLFLVVWEELSIADAARTLRIPAGTARYYLHRARLTLRGAPGMVALLTESDTEKEKK